MATVLIVEDDVFINMEAVFIVKELGHETLCAYDVEQALAILHADGQIDLLFTDIRLKDRHHGGYEIAMRAVDLRSDICVLYTSGAEPTDAVAAVALEGAHFLEKPYGDVQLRASLAAALRAAPARRPTV
jgi:CheY-like chemotaxis protein